jgi:hypothetical protein
LREPLDLTNLRQRSWILEEPANHRGANQVVSVGNTSPDGGNSPMRTPQPDEIVAEKLYTNGTSSPTRRGKTGAACQTLRPRKEMTWMTSRINGESESQDKGQTMETRRPPVVPTTGTAGARGPKGPTGKTKRPTRALSWNPPDRGRSTLAFLGVSAADGAQTGEPQGRGKTGKYRGRPWCPSTGTTGAGGPIQRPPPVPHRDRGSQGPPGPLGKTKHPRGPEPGAYPFEGKRGVTSFLIVVVSCVDDFNPHNCPAPS